MTAYLVRHGSAGHRDDSDPSDHGRRLDDKGWRQAARIADHICSEPLVAIVSSPLPRCVQTVEPLAEQVGLEIRIEPRLAEGAPIDQAWQVIEELGDSCIVLCSHGDIIPELIDRCATRGMHLPEKYGFAKGSVWALHGWDGTRFSKSEWDKLRR